MAGLTEAEARELVERHGSRRAAAEAIGVHKTTIDNALNREAARARHRRTSQHYRDSHPGRHADNQGRYWARLSPADRARQRLADRRRQALQRQAGRDRELSITDAIEILEGGQ